MKRLDAIMGSALWYALCFASVFLMIGQLTVMIWAIRDRRDRRVLLPAALNLLLGFGVFAVLMDCAYFGFVSEADAALFWPFERALFARPWLMYAALGALSAALLIPFIRDNHRYRARLEKGCDSIGFYSGFYVEPDEDGSLCSGRDELQARSGLSCAIDSFRRLIPGDEED
jgi:hypothetical protein